MLGALGIPHTGAAQALFESPARFEVARACPAFTSLRRETGAETLEMGRAYPAFGVNKPWDASEVQIEVGGGRKWVGPDCGRYLRAPPAVAGAAGCSGPAPDPDADAACLPFFDAVANPVPVGVGGPADLSPRPHRRSAPSAKPSTPSAARPER